MDEMTFEQAIAVLRSGDKGFVDDACKWRAEHETAIKVITKAVSFVPYWGAAVADVINIMNNYMKDHCPIVPVA